MATKRSYSGQLYRFEQGKEVVDVQDWYADGLPIVSLRVDPSLDGPANVERFFKQYRRARDGLLRVLERSEHLSKIRARFDKLAESSIPLDDLERELCRLRLVRKTAPAKRKQASQVRLPYRTICQCAPEAILVSWWNR